MARTFILGIIGEVSIDWKKTASCSRLQWMFVKQLAGGHLNANTR